MAARLLGLRVRIPPGTWMFVLCVSYSKEKRQEARTIKTKKQVWTKYKQRARKGLQIFRTRPDRPWRPPGLLQNGYRVPFPGVKQLGRRLYLSLQSSAEVKDTVELNPYSPSGLSWLVLEGTSPFTF